MSDSGVNRKQDKIWIFAGESSGDLYGAHLARELKTLCPSLVLQGMGGRGG